MDSNARPTRSGWLVILWAMALAPVAYGFVGASVAGSVPESDALPPLVTAFSVLAPLQLLLGAVVLARAPRLRAGAQGLGALLGGDALAEPAAFQSASVVGLALAESCAVLGFVLLFLGGRLEWYLPFGGAAIAVILAIGLPTGLAYWREREQADAAGHAPIE